MRLILLAALFLPVSLHAGALDIWEGGDAEGLKRDTTYFFSYQVATIGILYVMPESVSGWTQEAKDEYSLDKWWENVQHPHWDTDDWFINYVTHPYWGAAYYVRARERGYDRQYAFWYSAAMSTLFEFGVEALFEQPSIQDLISTPLGGLLFGEYMLRTDRRIRARHAAGGKVTFRDKVVLSLTDPLGSINRKVDDWLGRDADVSFRTFVTSRRGPPPGMFGPGELDPDAFRDFPRERTYGIQIRLTF